MIVLVKNINYNVKTKHTNIRAVVNVHYSITIIFFSYHVHRKILSIKKIKTSNDEGVLDVFKSTLW